MEAAVRRRERQRVKGGRLHVAQSHGATPRSTVNDTRARRPLDPNAKYANIDVRFRMGARANAAGKIVRVDSRFGEKRIENEPVDLLFRIPSNRIEYSQEARVRKHEAPRG